MKQTRRHSWLLFCLCLLATWGCSLQSCEEEEPEVEVESNGEQIEVESSRDGVFTILADGQRETLLAPAEIFLEVGSGIDVDANGRAILRFADLFSVEVLRDGELILQALAADEQSAVVTVLQNGGALLNDFNPTAEIEKRFTVQTEFATITATGTRFLVVREANSPLEWIIGLDAAGSDLEVTADGVTKSVVSDQARWVAPIGEPSAGIEADMNSVNNWLQSVQEGQPVMEMGQIVWDAASGLINTAPLLSQPVVGERFNLGTVEMEILSGSGRFTFTDCNNDGLNDLALQNSTLRMDFRPVMGRVQALTVTILNFSPEGGGQLTVLNPANDLIAGDQVTAGQYEGQVLSLRSDEPYHYAELTLADGCFLGFGIPPLDREGPPLAAAEVEGVDEVAAEQRSRPPENGQYTAYSPLNRRTQITIDGQYTDWEPLIEQAIETAQIRNVVPGLRCTADTATLNAYVFFAYNQQYLYTAFLVQDNAYVTYSGSGHSYFLGDSPQLLLDLSLRADFFNTWNSDDDIQLDFLPGLSAPGDRPAIAIWSLGTDPLESRIFDEGQIAVQNLSATNMGLRLFNYPAAYFLEAAIPWSALHIVPQPGLHLGLAASVSDNDTAGTNVQECMLSTSPNRNWQNPTTWGTLILAVE